MSDDLNKKDTNGDNNEDIFNKVFNNQVSENNLTPTELNSDLKPQLHNPLPQPSNEIYSQSNSEQIPNYEINPQNSNPPQNNFAQPSAPSYNAQPASSFANPVIPQTNTNTTINDISQANQGGFRPGGALTTPPPLTYGNMATTSSFEAQGLHPAPKVKEKKRGLLPLVACMLVTALLGGAIGAAIVATTDNNSNTPASTSGGNNVQQVSFNYAPESVVGLIDETEESIVGIRCTGASQLDFFNSDFSAPVVDEGSGVVYTEDGYIITNYHVVAPAVESDNENSKIEVFFQDKPEEAIPATFVDGIKDSDIAVIKIEKTGLKPIKIGSSADLQVGQPVIALGSPGGLNFIGSATTGIISGLNRTIATESSPDMTYIQTDAPINPGNSGGALIDSTGALIGINTAKLSSSGDTTFEGMGFAIPVDTAVEIADACIAGTVEHKTYLGVQLIPQITSEELEEAGYPKGVVVYNVVPGGPCDDAGVRSGDIITKFNGVEITTFEELQTEQQKYKPGDTIKLSINRGGEDLEVEVVLDQI